VKSRRRYREDMPMFIGYGHKGWQTDNGAS
jgi:hypothetical protein